MPNPLTEEDPNRNNINITEGNAQIQEDPEQLEQQSLLEQLRLANKNYEETKKQKNDLNSVVVYQKSELEKERENVKTLTTEHYTEVSTLNTKISTQAIELQNYKMKVDELTTLLGSHSQDSQINDTTEDHSMEMLQEYEITFPNFYKAALEKIARSTRTENAKKQNSEFKKKFEKQILEAKKIKPPRNTGLFSQNLNR